MLVVVDAENVRRSTWPNVSREQIVELLAHWAAERGADVLVVFDGPAPAGAARVDAVGTHSESADDWIIRHVGALDEPYVLVTSDRELRERAGPRAERVVGGGSFVRELQAAADSPSA